MPASRPAALLLAAALGLAACDGDDTDGMTQGSSVGDPSSVETDDVEIDDEGAAAGAGSDGTADAGRRSLPEGWPEELAVPDDDVLVAQASPSDDGFDAALIYRDDYDATMAYLQGLANEGWEVDLAREEGALLRQSLTVLTGFGWRAEAEVQEVLDDETTLLLTLVREESQP